MIIPDNIVRFVLAAILALEAWTLSAVVGLKSDVAGIKAELSLMQAEAKISPPNQTQKDNLCFNP